MPRPVDNFWEAEQAVLAALKNTSFDGDGNFQGIGGRIHSQLMPDINDGVTFPRIILSQEGESEQPEQGNSKVKKWRYPIRIWILDNAGAGMHEKKYLYLRWRKTIINLFDEGKIPDYADHDGCEIQTQVIFDPRLPQYQMVVSSLLLWVILSESRK